MPRSHPDLEGQLAAALHARSNTDQRVLQALESLQGRLSAGAALADLCGDLQEILSRVSTADPELVRLQQQWATSNGEPRELLQTELARQQHLLESLLDCVRDIEALAQADRERLRPERDTAARARPKCAAYAAAGRYR
jgi:hypothetical protein